MKTVKTNIYKFSELSDEAKEKALQHFAGINVDYEWWDFIYDDAKTIGLKITSFDTEHGNIAGELTEYMLKSIELIKENHGNKCQTYQTAESYLIQYKQVVKDYPVKLNKPEYDENEDKRQEAIESLEADYGYSLLGDYLILLRRELEYQQSEKAIIETINANEYDFTIDGKVFV